jgi:hypothetical protein
MKKIYIIGGGKGGVGKTMVALALVDFLLNKGEKVQAIESDESSSGFHWTLEKDETKEKNLTLDALNLEKSEGWIKLINGLKTDQNTVINTRGGNKESLGNFGELLVEAQTEIGMQIVTIWVINRGRECLEQLSHYFERVTKKNVWVAKNLHYGDSEKFLLFNDGKLKEPVERAGGILDFPDLSDLVANQLETERTSIASAMKSLPLGNRIELTRWRNLVRKEFEKIK